MTRLINEEWQEYKRKVVPKEASHAQKRETKQAFYAGATVLMAIVTRSFKDLGDDKEAGGRLMGALLKEIEDYAKALGFEEKHESNRQKHFDSRTANSGR